MRAQLFAKYKRNRKRFVETGTHTGAGIQAAIDAGFPEGMIVSFDVDAEKVRVADYKHPLAHIINAATPNVQFERIALGDVPALFWLDAHKMGPNGEIGTDYPLTAEINTLADSDTPHVILCDDVRLFGRYGTSVADIVKRMNKRRRYNYELATSKEHLPNDVLALIPEK